MERENVYKLIDGERDFQNNLGPERTDGHTPSVGDELALLTVYLQKAMWGYSETAGDRVALDTIRKIAAVCVRCMENHNTPSRE
jgi:hypothetical protein